MKTAIVLIILSILCGGCGGSSNPFGGNMRKRTPEEKEAYLNDDYISVYPETPAPTTTAEE